MKTGETAKFYLIIGISFAIMISFGFLPPFGAMTEYGMQMLGVFLGCIFGWLLGVNIPVTLLGIVVAGILISGQTIDSMITAVQSAQMILVMFWALIFIYGLRKCGLIDYLCKKMMSISWCKKSPWHLAVSLWLCTMVCTAFSCQAFAAMVLMFSMFYDVADKLGIERRGGYAAFVLVMIAGISTIGTGSVPYSNMILMSTTVMTAAVPDVVYNVSTMCLVDIAVTVATIVFISILFKILLVTNVIKPGFDMSHVDDLIENKAVLDTKVKWAIFYIVFLIVILVGPNFLPADSQLAILSNKIGSIGKFLLVVAMMCLTTIKGNVYLILRQQCEMEP